MGKFDHPLLQITPETKLADSKPLREYLESSVAANTRKTYQSALRQFEAWGGRLPTDRDTVVRYLLAKAGTVNPRTLDLHLTALSQWHLYQSLPDPTHDVMVRKAMKGIRHKHARPKQKARALSLEDMAIILRYLSKQPETPKRYRDTALVLTGFYGAFRRSELVGIQIEDIEWARDGTRVLIPRSKTDQSGEGIYRPLPKGSAHVCPTRALREWIDFADIVTGPVFRPVNRWGKVISKSLHPGAISDVLKELAVACELEHPGQYSAHSFRRGMSTAAAREQVDFELIKKQGGWKNDAVVRGYIEEGNQLTSNAAIPLMESLNNLIKQ